MISASRGDLPSSENKERNKSLEKDIRGAGYGFVHVRGRYIENYGKKDQREPSDEHSYMVIGKKGDDAGHLKGTLTKLGSKYNQDSVLHKSHNETNAKLHGTNETGYPGKDKSVDVGEFHPSRAGEFHSLLKGKGKTFTFEEYEFGFYLPKSFFVREEVLF